MIAVEHYIKELLFENECVILPKFGALLSSYKSAHYNSIKSTYYPPSKNVAFNSALTNNDWHLANEIATGESISKEEALVLVENFINEIEVKIQAKESYKIEEVGSFTLNKEGGVSFVPSLNSNYFEESFGLEPIQVSKVQVEEKSDQIIKNTEPNKKQTIMSENKKVEETEKQSSFFIIAPIILLLVAGGAFTWFMVDKTSFKNVASFGFIKGHETELVDETNEDEVHSVANSDEEHDEYVDHTSDSDDWADTDHNEETASSDDHHGDDWDETHTDSHEEVIEDMQEASHHEVAEVEHGSFHVVAGAFEVEDNANSFAQNIHGAKIIHGNRYHMVIVGSYDSESDATQAISSLQSEHGSGLWIFKN